MASFREVIEGLERNRAEFRLALEDEMEHAMEGAQKLAESFIGVEQPGWAPLAQSTIDDKQRGGYRTPAPLLRDGGLKKSFGHKVEPIFDGVEGKLGSSDETMIYHEHGTSRMPPRPVIGPALMMTEEKLGLALKELAIRTLTPGARLR